MARRATELPIHLGRFTAGMTGPAIPFVLARAGGGYLNCTGAALTGLGQRWDPRHLLPIGPVVFSGDLTPVDPARGHFLWDWLTTDLGTTPIERGIYVLTVDIILPNGQEFFPQQQATFEVISKPPGL